MIVNKSRSYITPISQMLKLITLPSESNWKLQTFSFVHWDVWVHHWGFCIPLPLLSTPPMLARWIWTLPANNKTKMYPRLQDRRNIQKKCVIKIIHWFKAPLFPLTMGSSQQYTDSDERRVGGWVGRQTDTHKLQSEDPKFQNYVFTPSRENLTVCQKTLKI